MWVFPGHKILQKSHTNNLIILVLSVGLGLYYMELKKIEMFSVIAFTAYKFELLFSFIFTKLKHKQLDNSEFSEQLLVVSKQTQFWGKHTAFYNFAITRSSINWISDVCYPYFFDYNNNFNNCHIIKRMRYDICCATFAPWVFL